MPKLRRGNHGYFIVSNRRGRFITHQLSHQGARLLQTQLGLPNIEGCEIDIATLIALKQSGHAYTQWQEEQGRRRERLKISQRRTWVRNPARDDDGHAPPEPPI